MGVGAWRGTVRVAAGLGWGWVGLPMWQGWRVLIRPELAPGAQESQVANRSDAWLVVQKFEARINVRCSLVLLRLVADSRLARLRRLGH